MLSPRNGHWPHLYSLSSLSPLLNHTLLQIKYCKMEINSSTSSAATATTTTAADNGSGKENDTTLSSLDPNELRQAANARFAASALDEALPLYTLAITTSRQRNDPPTDLIVHLCNRSACLYRMEMYAEACEDATEAVMLCGRENENNGNDTNCKAMFRLARAQIVSMFVLDVIDIGAAIIDCC